MEWISYKEIKKMFINAGLTNVNISYVLDKFSDEIEKKRIGLKKKLYSKQSVEKLIQKLLNE